MPSLRWFAPNRFCALPVAAMGNLGWDVRVSGDARADVVLAADGVSAVSAWQFARRTGAPLALYLWDLPPWQLGLGRPHTVVSIGHRLVKIPGTGSYPERGGYYSRLRYIAQRARLVCTPSAQSRDDVARRFDVAAIEVPFCFDSRRFCRSAGWHAAASPVVLAISRLVPYKNQAAIIRAASRSPLRPLLHLIGSGPEAMTLRAMAESLRVQLRLDNDWQSDEQILDAYLGASVLVSLSRFEGFGLTPLEGIALGMPVIASDIPPHREFAADGAMLVALDDDEALDHAISRALHADAPGTGDVTELTIERCAERMAAALHAIL